MNLCKGWSLVRELVPALHHEGVHPAGAILGTREQLPRADHLDHLLVAVSVVGLKNNKYSISCQQHPWCKTLENIFERMFLQNYVVWMKYERRYRVIIRGVCFCFDINQYKCQIGSSWPIPGLETIRLTLWKDQELITMELLQCCITAASFLILLQNTQFTALHITYKLSEKLNSHSWSTAVKGNLS